MSDLLKDGTSHAVLVHQLRELQEMDLSTQAAVIGGAVRAICKDRGHNEDFMLGFFIGAVSRLKKEARVQLELFDGDVA